MWLGIMYSSCFILFLLVTVNGDKQNDINFGQKYSFLQNVYLQDSSNDPVGFQTSGTLKVKAVLPNVLKVVVSNWKLHTMSRKAPSPLAFIPHISKLDQIPDTPFLLEFNDSGQQVKNIYVPQNEDASIVNLKKGIASLFQFSRTFENSREVDASGICSTSYESIDDSTFKRTKSNCDTDRRLKKIEESLWGGSISSSRNTLIQVNKEKMLSGVTAAEEHSIVDKLSNFGGISIKTLTEIKVLDSSHSSGEDFARDIAEVIKNVESETSYSYHSQTLSLNKQTTSCGIEDCESLKEAVKNNKKAFQEVGTSNSALAATKVFQAVKKSSAEEIFSVLDSKANKNILLQLMDILGLAQTSASHQAALKKLRLNADYNLDLCERYFWALSMHPQPKEDIVKELLELVRKYHPDAKLWATIVLTLTAMTKKLSEQDESNELVDEVISTLEDFLQQCEPKDEACRQVYLRSFSNFPSPKLLPTILNYSVNSTKMSAVTAIKVLHKMGPKHWDDKVLKLVEQVYLSNNSDTSAQTIAVDILLDSNIQGLKLSRLLYPLTKNTGSQEIKEYLLQRLNEKFTNKPVLEEEVKQNMIKLGINNYAHLATGALSTAFSRDFMEGGFLSTSQEIFNGVLKRGYVHVNLNNSNSVETLFTLGMFSNGLSSVMSSGSNEEENEETQAGLELTVLEVQLRPFVFFNGYGELTSHVWSGTASTLTPAYQALIILGDEELTLSLGAGFVVGLNLKSSASLELAGQIEISLWNRNAQSLVVNKAGLAVAGSVYMNTAFVQAKVEYNLLVEPQLTLSSNIDFSDEIVLCLQLEQPAVTVRYNVHKVERIVDSKHMIRKSRFKKRHVPGKTYNLNQKNNEMCNLLSR